MAPIYPALVLSCIIYLNTDKLPHYVYRQFNFNEMYFCINYFTIRQTEQNRTKQNRPEIAGMAEYG